MIVKFFIICFAIENCSHEVAELILTVVRYQPLQINGIIAFIRSGQEV